MSRKSILNLGIIGLIFVSMVGLRGVILFYADLPNRVSQQETIILGQNRLVPGGHAALRVVVRDSKDGSPLEGAQIAVALKPALGGRSRTVFTGLSDQSGTAAISFPVPKNADPSQILVIETHSQLGAEQVELPVTLGRDYRVLLMTDKPIYQPGQVIHIRALALSSFDRQAAANQPLEIVIADGKGNKVHRQTLATTEFGVAATDFQLASQVNTGAYKITATLGNTTSEKTVTVEHYVLPRFAVNVEADRTYYRPGQSLVGSVQADYFFGKPVASGTVSVEAFTFDVERTVFATLQGSTGPTGRFEFSLELPAYLAGSDLEGGLGRVYLMASVTDLAEHSETVSLSLPVASQALVIDAIPEGGQLRPGVENILYVLTGYPDGSPAQASLEVHLSEQNQTLTARSGLYGLAEVRFIPEHAWESLGISARDANGNQAYQEFYFDGPTEEETVLLRPDRPIYRVGDTMQLTILTTRPQGSVYLDLVREGQTVSTRAVPLEAGKAHVAVDLTPELGGTLTLHAYRILRSGTITRDTRLVVVDQAADLEVAITSGQEVYRPGDPASLDLRVSGPGRAGSQAAVGLAIVDESVFALAEQDPGFAKLYFLLEQELLTPRFDLHGFSLPELVRGTPQPDSGLQESIQDAARASLAAAIPQAGNFSLQANSHTNAVQHARERQVVFFGGLAESVAAVMIALPLAALGLTASTLQQEKRLGRSLGLVLLLGGYLGLGFFAWPLGESHRWVQTPLDRLGVLLELLAWGNDGLLVAVGALAMLGFLGVTALAWRRRDWKLGWTLILMAGFIVALGLLGFAAPRGEFSPPETGILAGLLAFTALPLAFLLRAAGFAWGRQALAALVTLALGLTLLFGALPALAWSAQAFSHLLVEERLGAEGALLGRDFLEAPMMALATPAPGIVEEEAHGPESSALRPGDPPRLRQFFPETMLWVPDSVTDPDGHLRIDFPVADSITTWRVTALASSQDGRLGSTTAPLRVFQDFFIDLDLPLALTVGDEISVPVGVFNYLADPQSVRLEMEPADWFELLDESSKEITLAANDISVVYFRIRANQFGQQPIKVTAWGSHMSDAIQKTVRVYPDGKEIPFARSDRLAAGQLVRQSVLIPADSVPGTQELRVKIYPGVVSQVIEGLESILRMPNGCFEQTSSTTYPNVLVLDYLQSSGQLSPEVQLIAEEYLNLGYQRLTTFEVDGSGGYSLFGEPPPDRMLTAYGLQEFADMRRVHDVDPALIGRAAEWLLSQQLKDGSWENDRGLVHEYTWSNLGNDRLPVTAYLVWSLVDAGFGDDARTRNGIEYVREHQSQGADPYVLALVANALVAADLDAGQGPTPATSSVLDRLASLAEQDGNRAIWPSGVATFMGGQGQTGSIETTALAALAFLRAERYPELASAALTGLIQAKDSFGTWYSTQATILSLKALIESLRAGSENIDARVTVSLNGGQARTLQITPENFDIVQTITFADLNLGQENVVEITSSGTGNLMYQVAGSYYLPWEKLPLHPQTGEDQDLVSIEVAYDRTELSVDDRVRVDVKVALNQPGGRAESALIDLGLPPGFAVQTEDLAALVARFQDVPADYAFPIIERFELTGRQILIYVSNLSADHPLSFSYHLQAKFPLAAQTPASNAYDYYNPDVAGEMAPQQLVVLP